MKFQTDGLIIREQNIGENDRLVWVLTRSNGVVKAFARGAKKLDSAKCSATSLLSYSRLTLYKSRENYIVGDAKTLRIFSKLRHDVRKMCLVQYFCEIARHICPREQPADEFLRLFLNSVYLLSENKRGELLVKACFEMRYMCMAGYKPDLLMCRKCGAYSAPLVYFLPREGKLECCNCRRSSDKVAPLSEAALTALRHTVFAEDSKLFSFALSDEGLKMLNNATELYLRCQLDRDFQALNFYKTITNG